MKIDLKKFALWYVLIIIGLIAISIALEMLAGISLPSAVSTIIPPMMAAMISGQGYVKNHGTSMESREMWSAALPMLAVVAVINIAFLIILFLVPDIRDLMFSMGTTFGMFAVGLFVILMGITYLVIRLGLGMGMRTQMKELEKTKAK